MPQNIAVRDILVTIRTINMDYILEEISELMIIFLRVTMAVGPWRGTALFLGDSRGRI